MPVVLAVACLLLAVVALGLGTFPVSPWSVVTILLGGDEGFATTVVRDFRLPRVLAALVFGGALGAAGAVFQSLTRNPLGSPDVIGFSTGAYTGALVVITVTGQAFASTAIGALAGGLVTALVVYVLAWRGGVQGFRLIVVGVAVTALLSAVNSYLLLRVDTQTAVGAAIWGAGSISLVQWDALLPAVVALGVAGVALGALHRGLRQLELGDDAARAHGVATEPVRLALLVVGVALTAVTTAVAGPVAFVALAAPQVAARLTRSAGLPLVASALTGALLLLGADQVAQHVVPKEVPVGTVTVVVGGVYLLWLLVRGARRAS
ncbi:iron-enterobactin transporter permease [Marmoricola endophyticus]|uniref:Iron-enterobactin transporter permease n=1 Tax=Marmoricola endophyticus TaxID=2040280 RepID=A0A917BJK5_9ACTN|nr:iron-enterobactin transporter permease [Marmoricola endophyticus]